MKELPNNITALRSTTIFTEKTIPAALLKDHSTAAGTWGLIQVKKGKLEYTIGKDEIYILEPGKNGVVEPTVVHHVKPLGEVEFKVQFYK